MQQHLRAFWQDESGATAIEYGVLAGFISIGVVVSIDGVVSKLADLFSYIQAGVREAAGIN